MLQWSAAYIKSSAQGSMGERGRLKPTQLMAIELAGFFRFHSSPCIIRLPSNTLSTPNLHETLHETLLGNTRRRCFFLHAADRIGLAWIRA